MSIWQRIAGAMQDVGDTVSGYFGSSTPPEKSVAFTIWSGIIPVNLLLFNQSSFRDTIPEIPEGIGPDN